MESKFTHKKISERQLRENDIANSDEPLITRMMQILEHRGYVDTDWWNENTFEDDVRPLFEKMIAKSLHPLSKKSSLKIMAVHKHAKGGQQWTPNERNSIEEACAHYAPIISAGDELIFLPCNDFSECNRLGQDGVNYILPANSKKGKS